MSSQNARLRAYDTFQCSSASRKFLNCGGGGVARLDQSVSVLFSEPKIPQSSGCSRLSAATCRFSALQRAENSSIVTFFVTRRTAESFSALQRAENSSIDSAIERSESGLCFSALQRAENSSICSHLQAIRRFRLFQCSSASRKFLNWYALFTLWC